MKKKVILGSILVVFMLMLLPSITAVQLNTELTKYSDFEKIKNLDINELLEFIVDMSEDYPIIQEEIIVQIEEMEDKDIFLEELEELSDSNQSFIEKIWLRVFNYRLFRLYLSFWILVYTQSKITLIRTIHWGMKALRWIQIGIVLGIVDLPQYEPPETPDIIFEMDMENNTLSVGYVSVEDVMWSEIDQIGSGTCDPLPTGNVTVGDEITNCMGIIVLRYLPTNEIIGVFEFV